MSRAINADLPKAAPPAPAPGPKPATTGQKTGGRAPRGRRPDRRPRQPVPGALKAIAALFALALVFIVAAVLGGGSSEEDEGPSTAGPAPIQQDDARSAQAPDAGATELGFPAFATSNTTRVGGGDPASNAAGVALAVYPATEEALRPAAVTLVGTDDWQGAIAAAVLIAEPVRAPLLFAEGDDLPEPTAVEPASPAATAVAVARLRDRLHGRPPRHILIASLTRPELAAPATAWAARSGDPVLFTGPRKLPAPTRAYLRRHRGLPVYVLGPSSAIPSDTIRQIAKVAGDVSRVSGEDPVANAVALARYEDGDFGWNVNDPGHGFVVARSDSPLDAVAAAPLSASGTWGPLLLTDSADTLPEGLRDYLLDVKPGYTTDPTRAFYNHVWVIGDEEAIEVSEQAEIDALAELARIGGGP